jgi:hypothetical protein
MMKAFKQELFVLLRRWPAMLLILLVLLGNYGLGGLRPIGVADYSHKVNAQCYELRSKWFYEAWSIQAANSKFSRLKPEEVIAAYGLEDAGIQDYSYEVLFPLTAKAQYVRILWFLGGLIFLCAVLPPVLIRYPLYTGVPDLTARLTRSRRRTALGRIAVYAAAVLFIGLVSILIQIWAFAGSILSRAGFGYVLYTVLLRLLTDLAVLSLPMFLGFAIRSTPLLILLNTVYGAACYALNVAASRLETAVPIPVPAWLHGLRPLWERGGPGGWIAFSVLVSLAWISLFTLLSLRCFDRAEARRFGVREAERSLK